MRRFVRFISDTGPLAINPGLVASISAGGMGGYPVTIRDAAGSVHFVAGTFEEAVTACEAGMAENTAVTNTTIRADGEAIGQAFRDALRAENERFLAQQRPLLRPWAG